MIYTMPIEEVIQNRKSVRTYNNTSLTQEQKNRINEYMNTVSSPLEGKIRFQLIDGAGNPDASAKYGTYGFIKGARQFIGIAASKGDKDALLNVGYTFEKIVLFLASINLGTCWLGGTFNRSDFAIAMNLQEDETIPIVSPIGMAAVNQGMLNSMMRKLAKSDNRKPFNENFFNGNFETPLSQQNAGDYLVPLEMLRLAPSASNSQPWRVLKIANCYHFYMQNKYPAPDMSIINMGIAMCHFELTAIEKGLKGSWISGETPGQKADDLIYIRTWQAD